jgi:hypothetical protein
MASAIENSECVLMCITEKYKQSPNCRLEAEYAVNLNKPIIPLIMQKSYKADGWLGLIMGSKIFVDFTKYDYQECIKRLLKELTPFIDQHKKNSSTTTDVAVEDKNNNQKTSSGIAPHTSPSEKSKTTDTNKLTSQEEGNHLKRNALISWTVDDVNKWIDEKKIHKIIKENIAPCNGELLSQYYGIYKNAPEFFFRSINPNAQLTLKDSAHFLNELSKLFS